MINILMITSLKIKWEKCLFQKDKCISNW